MDNRVYGLMEAAEAQQQAVERALEALKTTRQEIQAALIQGAAQGTKAALNEATAPISDNLKQAAQAANQASKDLSDHFVKCLVDYLVSAASGGALKHREGKA